MKGLFSSLAVLALGAVAQAAMADGLAARECHGKWAWIRVEPAADNKPQPFEALQGTTSLACTANGFSADLVYDDGHYAPHHHLDAHIDGNRVTATEILLNSDAGKLTYTGILGRTPEGAPWIRLDTGLFVIVMRPAGS